MATIRKETQMEIMQKQLMYICMCAYHCIIATHLFTRSGTAHTPTPSKALPPNSGSRSSGHW